MKTITCWMLIVMVLTAFVTLGGQVLAAEDDGGTGEGSCEFLRQAPATIFLSAGDGGPAEVLNE